MHRVGLSAIDGSRSNAKGGGRSLPTPLAILVRRSFLAALSSECRTCSPDAQTDTGYTGWKIGTNSHVQLWAVMLYKFIPLRLSPTSVVNNP